MTGDFYVVPGHSGSGWQACVRPSAAEAAFFICAPPIVRLPRSFAQTIDADQATNIAGVGTAYALTLDLQVVPDPVDFVPAAVIAKDATILGYPVEVAAPCVARFDPGAVRPPAIDIRTVWQQTDAQLPATELFGAVAQRHRLSVVWSFDGRVSMLAGFGDLSDAARILATLTGAPAIGMTAGPCRDPG